MKKILHVMSALDNGGVENMIYNYISHMKQGDYSFSFIVHGDHKGAIEKKMIEFGFNVFHVCPKKKNPFKNYFQIKSIIKSEKWDAIHCHQGFSNVVPLFLAKRFSIPIRISHAHGESNRKIRFKKILRKLINKYSSVNVACSQKAGNAIFGINKYVVLKNAIDCEKFKFDYAKRQKTREKLNVEDESILFLQIGRLSKEKNHAFTLEVLSKINFKFKFLIIGDGPLKTELEAKVKQLNLVDKVLFVDSTFCIEDYMFASDILLFPSTNEGFGMVAVEGQSAGLLVLASDIITTETKISDMINYLPLDEKTWFDEITYVFNNKTYLINKKNGYNNLCKSGFSLDDNLKIYEKILKGEKYE